MCKTKPFIVASLMVAFLGLGASSAFASKTTVYLKNGDKLSGVVTYEPGGIAAIETAYGVLRVPMTETRFIGTTSAPSDAVQTNSPSMLAIERATAQQRPAFTSQNITTPTVTAAAAAQPVEPKKAEKPKDDKGLWGAKWSGNANLGAGLTSGNTETNNINADAELKARWKKDRFTLYTDFNREEDDSNITVDNRSLDLGYDRFLSEQWFVNLAAEFEQDDIAQLDLQSEYSLGVGHQPYERDDLNLKYVLGAGFLTQDFENGDKQEDVTASWAFDYDQKIWDDLFRLFHNHDLDAPADDFGAFTFESRTGVRLPLKKGIVTTAEVEFDWDNEPPATVKEEDVTYSLKLGYDW